MRILVVEDERKVADFVKRGLQEAQHVVDAAASIAEAEDLVSGQDYDLLIIDCMLPDGDGRHFCRDLRARSGYFRAASDGEGIHRGQGCGFG